ncbi:MAG: DUF3309 family protein [Xanthobacteraceae bacterium]|nr:DUF3309 family protein [Xanthobacteraceae bacterium]
MTLGTLLVVVLVIGVIAVAPNWDYSRRWGYGPAGLVSTLLVIVVILLLFGKI